MRHEKLIRVLPLTLLAVSAIGLSACTNTVDGAGQDIERAGEKVQQSVHR